jgi:hypothetical protein
MTEPLNFISELSSGTIDSMRLMNREGGEFIVGLGHKQASYPSLSNVIDTTIRDSYKIATPVSIDLPRVALEALFNIGPLMIIVKDIREPDKTEILVMAFNEYLYKLIDLSPKGGVKKHRCYIIEQKFFDGKNGALPDGFNDISCDTIRIQIGKEGKKDYFIILNNLTVDANGAKILVDNGIGQSGAPPGIGVKVPTNV